MQQHNKGALTIEAALSFPIYILAILTVINFLNIFYTHAIVQQALNHTANLISQYVYVLDQVEIKQGGGGTLEDFFVGADEDLEDIGNAIDNMTASAKQAINGIADGITLSELPDILTNFENFANQTKNLANAVKELNNSMKIARLIVNTLIGDVNGSIVRVMVETYLNDMQLNMAHIENIQYNGKLTRDGDIYVYMRYQYKNPLGTVFFDSIDMAQRSVVHGWIGD